MKKTRGKARRKAENTQQLTYCITLRKRQAELQHAVKHAKRTSFKTFLTKLDFRKVGPKAHRYVSSLNNNKTRKEQQPLLQGNKELTDPADIANALCKHYANISRVRGDKRIAKTLRKQPLNSCLESRHHKLFVDKFTISELDLALSKTKTKKAAGPDGILPEFLINLGREAKKTLLAMINLTWQKHVPQQWRKGENPC